MGIGVKSSDLKALKTQSVKINLLQVLDRLILTSAARDNTLSRLLSSIRLCLVKTSKNGRDLNGKNFTWMTGLLL